MYEDDDEQNIAFSYLEKGTFADKKNARLSVHSPNFKLLVEELKQKTYQIYGIDDSVYAQIPSNLCLLTQELPNFLTNESLLFVTEDNIIKCYNFKERKEDWIMTHCDFPGQVGPISLATLLKVGNHVIGENCLTYEQLPRKSQKKQQKRHGFDELVAPNNFNPFFLDAAKEHHDKEEYSEIKIIQCHYKSKLELAERSYNGYYFSLNELAEGKSSTELYIISTYSYYDWRTLSQIKNKKINIHKLGQE